MSWHDELRNSIKKYQFHPQQDVEAVVGNWMKQSRLQGRLLMPEICKHLYQKHKYFELRNQLNGLNMEMMIIDILKAVYSIHKVQGISTEYL